MRRVAKRLPVAVVANTIFFLPYSHFVIMSDYRIPMSHMLQHWAMPIIRAGNRYPVTTGLYDNRHGAAVNSMSCA